MQNTRPLISQGITILGSTGSIGESTLKVLALHPGRYHVIALSAHGNVERLAEQCKQFQARYAVISDEDKAPQLQAALNTLDCSAEVLGRTQRIKPRGLSGRDRSSDGCHCWCSRSCAYPACSRKVGKRLLLANKESMVIAGELFRKAAFEHGATIIPVDSEHNALFQVLPRKY